MFLRIMHVNLICLLMCLTANTRILRCRGVLGPLVDLFDCAESLYSAVEVTAGGSLFHVVVDSDVTASAIMRHLIAQRVGRITCLPLNKLNVSQHSRANVSWLTVVVQVLF